MPSDGGFSVSLASATPSSLSGLVGPIVPGLFAVDQLSLVVLICLAALAALLILCAPATGTFFRHLVMLLFFFIGAFGVVTATHVITFFGTWEIASLFAWGIAQLAGESQAGDEGVVPFQAAGALGSFSMLLGLALLATDRHDLSLGPLNPASVPPTQLWPVTALILIAIFFKTYGLLSEEWSGRPNPTFSLAGATLAGAGVLTIGVYPFLRFFGPILGGVPGWQHTAFWGGAALAIVSALAAIGDVDFRRTLSYGILSQLGLLAAILATSGSAALPAVLTAAVADAFAFTGLFICLGMAEEATSQVLLRHVGGLAQRLPLTAFLYLLCTAVLVGLPPLGNFVAYRLVGVAAQTSPTLLVVWIVVLALTLIYVMKLFAAMFLGEPRGPVRSERWWPMIMASGGVVGTLALLALLAPDILGMVGA